jgi:hypothetical protein
MSEKFARFEYKYLLSNSQFERLINVIDLAMELDSYCKANGSYLIKNIYYDDTNSTLISNSMEKPIYKEKVRVRAYGNVDKNSQVYVELKKKYNGFGYKRRIKSDLSSAFDLLNFKKKDIITQSQIEKELRYTAIRYKLIPKMYISYSRIAYSSNDNVDLRITFDTNIRFRNRNISFIESDLDLNLLDNNVYLLEIKTTASLPIWLTSLLNDLKIYPSSFSKYGNAIKKLRTNKEKNVCSKVS